ncbi:MAG: substrate-binding domain-containing protein [Anaerolineae bacterium]|nr:substrate-binding domain-containing protein [Anaerolineae bacterium]
MNVRDLFPWPALLLLVLMAACQAEVAETPEPAVTVAPVTVGLLLPETENPYFVSIREGAEEAAARTGARLVVDVAGGDADRQVTAGRQMLERGVSALAIVPVDAISVVPLIELANEVAIPVLTIERRATAGDVLTHISSDNVAGGNIAGDYLARAISGRGRVVELGGQPGTSAAQERSAGFEQALRTYPEVQLLASETGNFERAQAQAVFAYLLEEYPQIDAVFAHNDAMILGAIEAARAVRRDDEIVFIGFDAISEAIDAIEAGDLRATVAQQPKEMGRLAVELAVDYLRLGSQPEPETVVDLSLVTR